MEQNTITLEQAIAMTTLYRSEKDNILKPEFAGRNILSRSESFSRTAFDQVLSQTDCVGLRIYFGMNPDLQIRTIIVGVNSKNEDMLPEEGSLPETRDGGGKTIIEEGGVCPPICPPPSDLNP